MPQLDPCQSQCQKEWRPDPVTLAPVLVGNGRTRQLAADGSEAVARRLQMIPISGPHRLGLWQQRGGSRDSWMGSRCTQNERHSLRRKAGGGRGRGSLRKNAALEVLTSDSSFVSTM
eukprot:scaffold837_cov416-Prasinococcus_capsulatus_cf.AAC.4